MRNIKLIGTVVTVAIAATITGLVLTSPTRGSARYHLARLGSLRQQPPFVAPSSFRDYLRPRTWSWYLRGKPSISDNVAAMEAEQQALIKLGRFERSELTFNHRAVDGELWREFRSAVSNSPLAEFRYMLHLDTSRPSVIRVTTDKMDIPVFQTIAADLNTKTDK
jgi:hypothetical protein